MKKYTVVYIVQKVVPEISGVADCRRLAHALDVYVMFSQNRTCLLNIIPNTHKKNL